MRPTKERLEELRSRLTDPANTFFCRGNRQELFAEIDSLQNELDEAYEARNNTNSVNCILQKELDEVKLQTEKSERWLELVRKQRDDTFDMNEDLRIFNLKLQSRHLALIIALNKIIMGTEKGSASDAIQEVICIAEEALQADTEFEKGPKK